MIRVIVLYVDGREFNVPVGDWASLPMQGIDKVAIGSNGRFTFTSGQSIYWVYEENDYWIMGAGPVGYGEIPPEILVFADGTQSARSIRFMPDLHIENVKLGWWWPDEERRPVDGDHISAE